MSNALSILAPIGRLLIGGFFIKAGYDKLLNPAGAEGILTNLPFDLPIEAGLAVYAVIALEILGGLAIVLGLLTRLAALGLFVFTMAASFLVHNWWAMPPEQQFIQSLLFYKNMGVAGGLMMIIANGAGALSIGRNS